MIPGQLPADAWMRGGPVDDGWKRAIRRGPVTVDQALARGLQAMLEEDEAERHQRDPLMYAQAQRQRRTLLGRLLRR